MYLFKSNALFFLISAAVILAPHLALAQLIPEVPSTIDPSQIDRQLQPPPVVEPVPAIQVPRTEDTTPPPGAEAQRFQLTALEITGATVYSPERLREFYGQFIGQEISLGDLYNIANQITQLYRNDGFVLSRAIIPEQTIQNGVARIEVIEGFIEQVSFQGAPPGLQQRLQAFGDRIVASRPLNTRDLERYLLLANDLAGIQLSSVLSPGSQQGAVILTVNTTYTPINAFVDLNNRGTPEIGPLRLQAGVFLNSLFQQGERIILSGATTPEDISELANGGIAVNLPVGTEGLRVGLNTSYTAVRPGERFREFDINGENFNAGLEATYPLIRSRARNLFVNGRFDYNDSRNITLFTGEPQTLSEDRLRVLRLGLLYNEVDAEGRTTLGGQVSQGLGIFGATTEGTLEAPLSRADASAVFTKLNFNVTRQNILPGPLGLALELSGAAQITGNALLIGEQFALGGERFGSAFNPAAVTGDSGFGLRAELQRPFRYQTGTQVMVTQPYLFADYGQVFRKFPTQAENLTDTLSSTGLGVRHNLSNFLILQLELAVPLIRSDAPLNQDPRLFFSVQGFF